jgi:hypothetical protein
VTAIAPPPFRRLRGYAFDPSLSTTLDTAQINVTTFPVPWEKLTQGPVGEYLEVVDYDPASARFYEPVDLDHPHLLAQDGLAPSESSPQAHQQMVYAVAMTTIRHFEKALGRRALWSAHKVAKNDYRYVPRLRIYPHALRGANAFYSQEKKALLFGYFSAPDDDGIHAPGSTVFTCLSHDIIAHETTHALLDGMHRRFIEPTHADSLAFHEAFADLVALFQHFTFSEVLRHQIAKTRGDLATTNLLAELAQEFGRALGQHGALRTYLGQKPDPAALVSTLEPHARGAILVAAVFEAFTTIYQVRARRFIELATGGSGVLPAGALAVGLVEVLAGEAAKTADHFLNMCIRALDYCPPVGLTFGDYLCALITADVDLVPDDPLGYRVALVDAFRKRGIFPGGVTNLSEEALCWPSGEAMDPDVVQWLVEKLRVEVDKLRYVPDREALYKMTSKAAASLHVSLQGKLEPNLVKFGTVCGLMLDPGKCPPGIKKDQYGVPTFEIHTFRTALRARPDGTLNNHVIVTLTQREWIKEHRGLEGYFFRGGATLIFDLDTMELRRCIAKPIGDEARRHAYEAYMRDELPASVRASFASRSQGNTNFEPFAFLHGEDWEGAHDHE